MTLEDLLLEVHKRALFLHNLFQMPDGTWQANVRSMEHHYEFGRADTPAGALQAALDKAAPFSKKAPVNKMLNVFE